LYTASAMILGKPSMALQNPSSKQSFINGRF
jgi:hypothetical protein